jgi:hypothetical protein
MRKMESIENIVILIAIKIIPIYKIYLSIWSKVYIGYILNNLDKKDNR